MRHAADLLLLGAALGAAAPAAAQQARPLTFPPPFVIDQWTTRDGLPQNSVNAIALAPDGSLWIGTFGGLVRFDGASFRLLERLDSAGRHVDRVLSLAVDRDSSLWIGTETGLLHYQESRYQSYVTTPGLRDNGSSVLYIDRAGVLWIGTPRGGLVRRTANGFEAIAEVAGAAVGPVVTITEDADGALWVNAGDRLLKLEPRTRAAAWVSGPVPGAFELALVDRAGARWFSLPDGFASVSSGGVRRYRREDGVSRPTTLVEDPGGGYWVGTQNDGLFFFQPGGAGTVRHFALPDGRRQFRIRVGLSDNEGSLWFGTNASGLIRVRRNVFATFGEGQGLSNDVMTAVFGDAAGVMWVGTNCWGVNAVDLDRRTVRVFKPRKPGAGPRGDPCVFSLTESPPGTMWAGTYGGGLTRVRAGREEWLRHLSGLRDSVVLALFTDRAGTVWAGTNTGGLAMLDGTRVRSTWTTAEGLAHNSVRTIYQGRDGVLWIGTLGGLSRLKDGQLTSWTAADGLSAEPVRAIYQDTTGTMWIGTYGGGLNRFRDGVFTAITRRDGLADDVVSSILEDAQGRFWMSGNRGISRVAREDLVAFAEGRSRRVHAVLYGEDDGLRNAETNGGFQPAAWRDARGRLWFPTVRGLAMVDPATVKVLELGPAVSVEEVVVDGVTRTARSGLTAGPGRPNLEFRYTGISLSAPQHLTFRYRLYGFDKDWVEAGTRRVAYYPRLPPGRYRFAVRAANRDGVWSETGAEMRLRVTAPLWDAWWFRLAVTALLLALAFAEARRRVIAARSRRAAREEFSRRLIESQEHERKRIAGELHDGLGQELLVVKNRALLALQADSLPAPARVQLEQISAITSQSLTTVRGLAHNLTPYQLDHLGLSAALRAMVEAAAGAVDIVFQAIIDDVDGLQPVERQINLYRIVQEAVNNVVAHSAAAEAVIQVRRIDGAVAVTVRDDGRGFRVQGDREGGLAGGFGLSGMAERVRILGGQVTLTSAPGEGTRLEVTVPLVVSPEAGGA